MTDYSVSTYRRPALTQRRLRNGLFWLSDNPPPRNWKALLRDVMFVCAGLAFLFGILMWMQARDLEVQLDEQRIATKRYSRMLADCLNGGGLYDKAHNQALFCDRAITLRF